ncbi:hypothetical protein EV646_10346 [Kribbella antiqua]|uniref:LPXTG-motif cell wall-anchored protein n=1 Tax=Kribbella antiqua TaxID=2512217 RepID=A0A4R2IYM5_9ACTN|nr:hypothetical protein [Kribbella antiqua]TCO49069.1 hypothetical protein EV646_10346 [Kribbella antiqua]
MKSKSSRAVALLGGAGALALALGGVTLATAPSASAETVTTVPGNPKCSDLIAGSTEIKFDPPTPGSKEADGVTVTWTKTGDLVNFTATGGSVLGAIIKGGPNANFYDYRPGGTIAGVGLHTPVNDNNGKYYGISHVSFCVGEGTTPTPTETPTTTPTPTETPTTTPTPTETPTTTPTPTETPTTTPTPTETPTTTPSETPTTTPSETPTTTPTVSPTSTATSPTVGVPTEVPAGLDGGLKSTSASTGNSSQSIWGIALLGLGGLLVSAGVLKARQRRGQHSA